MENVLLVVESIGCVWRPQTHQDLLAGIDVYKSVSKLHAGRRTNLRTQAYSFGVSVRVELRIDVTGQGILTKEVWTVGEELREDRENPAMLAHDGFDERGYPLE